MSYAALQISLAIIFAAYMVSRAIEKAADAYKQKD